VCDRSGLRSRIDLAALFRGEVRCTVSLAGADGGGVEHHPSLEKAISLGYVSVSFFFFLSGYILSVAYLSGGHNFPSKANFYSARFARIYPLYILTIILDTPD
jgi:peptidoglycan/LPS O-acetylase OafA/YrhL